MKKITIFLLVTCFALTLTPMHSSADAPRLFTDSTLITPPAAKDANALLLRLTEIRDMDKSNLSASEKKALRKEVRSLKQEYRHAGRGVYISIGAAIIIILLLIIIL
jgi:hypothetical protein